MHNKLKKKNRTTPQCRAIRQTIQLPEHTLLTEKIIEHLDDLFHTADPERLRKSLYEMFFSHLIHADIHHRDLREIAEDFYFLFEFLEAAKEEMAG